MAARIRILPWHLGQILMSMLKTRLRSLAQDILESIPLAALCQSCGLISAPPSPSEILCTHCQSNPLDVALCAEMSDWSDEILKTMQLLYSSDSRGEIQESAFGPLWEENCQKQSETVTSCDLWLV